MEPSAIAQKLVGLKKSIIAEWVTSCREEISASAVQTDEGLIDSLDELLDSLAELLENSGDDRFSRLHKIARVHGTVRAHQQKYRLRDVQSEYRILRKIIMRHLPEHTSLIHEGLDLAIAEASSVFMGLLDLKAKQESEAKEAYRNQLSFERHQLQTVFNESPASMALWKGRDLVFTMANPQYHKIFGDRELVGKTLIEAVPELAGQGFEDELLKVFETGTPLVGREVLAQHRTKEGGPIEDRYYNFTYLRITETDGEPYGVYDHAIDVTDRVHARRALEKAISDLEQERDLREKFVGALSHDLRTPITAAKMSAQILQRKGDPQQAKVINRIISNMDRADQMIRDLLDAGKIKAGEKVSLELTHCHLGSLIKETVDNLNAVHGNRIRIDASGEISGYWDCSVMRRVLENLVNNAIKYGAHDAPVLVTASKSSHSVELSVHNTGNPIPAEETKTLFQPFKRSDSAKRSSEKGWGMGLTLVRGFVEAMGGSIAVFSAPESGTTFTIMLPIDARANP